MAHKSHEQLANELKVAAQQVEVGGQYCHYKHPDRHYTVIGLSILEATDEVCVIYQPVDQELISFVRPLSSWLDVLEIDGQSVPRFQRFNR